MYFLNRMAFVPSLFLVVAVSALPVTSFAKQDKSGVHLVKEKWIQEDLACHDRAIVNEYKTKSGVVLKQKLVYKSRCWVR